MQSQTLAEPNSGKTISTLKQWASLFQLAICGSYIATDNGQFYNRAFFLTPEGEYYFYDKRHLFRMGREAEHFSAGNKRIIIPYHGWNICLLVCYDLRFPVWSRNVKNEYDLLIYVANWPIPRRLAWDALLRARALENQCYVCGVNRIGTDGYRLHYNGGSVVYSALGEEITSLPDGQDDSTTVKQNLFRFRRRNSLIAGRTGRNNDDKPPTGLSTGSGKVSGLERCRRISSLVFAIKQMLKTD